MMTDANKVTDTSMGRDHDIARVISKGWAYNHMREALVHTWSNIWPDNTICTVGFRICLVGRTPR